MTKLDIISQIADLKEIDYKNTLAIACIIELLIENGIINRSDVSKKAYELENATLDEIENRLVEPYSKNKLNIM
jgi:hypothetical protein